MGSHKHNFGETIDSAGVDLYPLLKLALYNIPDAAAADTDNMVDGEEATTGEEAEPLLITEFEEQPDVPRNIVIVLAATTAAHVAAGNIVVTYKNFNNQIKSYTHAVTADTPATFTGAVAVKELISVLVPVQDGASVTVDVGFGAKLGLPYCLSIGAQVLRTVFNGVLETTAPTIVVDSVDVEKNTIQLNSTLDGAKDVDLILAVR